MAPQLFVYYRVRSDHVPAATAALRALQASWQRDEPALGCELMQRIEDGGHGQVTLMEVYRHAQGVPPTWRQRIEREARAALAPWLVGERRLEVFTSCA